MKRMITLIIMVAMLGGVCGCAGNASEQVLTQASEQVLNDDTTKPQNAPVVSVTGETDLPGNFYISFVYSRNILMLDGKGNIVWSKHEDEPVEGRHTGFWDFKKHVVDGKTYYSYHDQTGNYDDYGLQGYAPGERVILDANFNEVKRITFEKSDVTEKGAPLDGHDFLMIDLDHYILSGYINTIVTNNTDFPDGSSVVGSYLQEVQNGKVVWDWSSVDYSELYALTVNDAVSNASDFANATTGIPDYVHFNAMRLDDDGNLICSFRHLNSILCLDRAKDSKQILWKLSGKGDEFGLTDAQKMSSQHYVTMDGEYITCFDNGNSSETTRIVSYKTDTQSRNLLAFKEYTVGGKYSIACGNVQHLKDELYVIGWGAATKDAECMTVYNFALGEPLMSVFLNDPQNITYRCVYYD